MGENGGEDEDGVADRAAQVADSGKPPEIVEKMVEGRLRKYLDEICLVSQTFVKTNVKTMGELLEQNGATMKGFSRVDRARREERSIRRRVPWGGRNPAGG